MDVLISAGHYEEKPGAKFGNFVEHEEASIWVDKIIQILSSDLSIDKVPSTKLSDKIEYINGNLPVLAIEIHFNDAVKIASDGRKLHIGRGCETLYCPGSKFGRVAAQIVQNQIATIFQPSRGIKEGHYRMNPKNGPDAFLGKTKCIALIVEPDFVVRSGLIESNREEGCKALAHGILSAFNVLSNVNLGD